MKPYYNSKHKSKIDLNPSLHECYETTSTLLIPLELFQKLESQFGIKKKMRDNLSFFLQRYRGFFGIGNLPFSSKVKTVFQEEGLHLQSVHFRPKNADWIELGIIAYGLGVSRCWLFSYMLDLEFREIGKFFNQSPVKDLVSTATNSRPKKIWQITGRRRYFERILHFRI